MKMFIVLVLSAAFALPAAFATEQDVITLQAYEELLKNGAANGMTKTVISNPVLEEALVSYTKNKFGGSAVACGESCVKGKCYTPGCTCVWPICKKNSLESTKSADPLLEEALDGAANGMTKTVISNPVLEEALVSYSKNKFGGSAVACGESCVKGKCYTPGCTCVWPICKKNSLENTKSANPLLEEALDGAANGMTKTVISNPVLEEALTAFSKKGLEGRLCGEKCVIESTKAWCKTVGCICSLQTLDCVKNSLAM